MSSDRLGVYGNRRVWAVALLVAVVFTVLGTPRAMAHNALVATSPGDGKTVAQPPSSVVLTFNEPAVATGTKVLVTGPDGSVSEGAPRLVDTTVEQDLRSGLPAGEYTVEWRVTSADGHPVNGSFTFRIRTGSGSGSLTPTPAPPATPASTGSPGAPAEGSSAGWLWLLVIVPVGLAAILGWRRARTGR